MEDDEAVVVEAEVELRAMYLLAPTTATTVITAVPLKMREGLRMIAIARTGLIIRRLREVIIRLAIRDLARSHIGRKVRGKSISRD